MSTPTLTRPANRRIVSVIAAGALAAGALLAGPASSASAAVFFSDVPAGAPFYKEVMWLAARGVTTGYADGTFKPKNAVNRDAMAAFMYRYAKSPAFTAPTRSPFTDMTPTSQFYKEVTWLARKGISTGYPDKTFKPTSPVSREAMAAFLYRFAGKPAWTAPARSPFTDMTPTSPFYKEVTWLASKGISTGYADRTFKPKSAVTREAMAAFMYRYAGSPAYTPPKSYYWTGTGTKTFSIPATTVPMIATITAPGSGFYSTRVDFIGTDGRTLNLGSAPAGKIITVPANTSITGAKSMNKISVSRTSGSWSVQLFPMNAATPWDGKPMSNYWHRVVKVGPLVGSTPLRAKVVFSGNLEYGPTHGNAIVNAIDGKGDTTPGLVNEIGAGTYEFTVPAGTYALEFYMSGSWTFSKR